MTPTDTAEYIMRDIARSQGRVNTVILDGYGVQSIYMATVMLLDRDPIAVRTASKWAGEAQRP